jgi:hypothetical protein
LLAAPDHLLEISHFCFQAEGDTHTLTSDPCCSTDSVYILGHFEWNFKVDDCLHILDIEATCS